MREGGHSGAPATAALAAAGAAPAAPGAGSPRAAAAQLPASALGADAWPVLLGLGAHGGSTSSVATWRTQSADDAAAGMALAANGLPGALAGAGLPGAAFAGEGAGLAAAEGPAGVDPAAELGAVVEDLLLSADDGGGEAAGGDKPAHGLGGGGSCISGSDLDASTCAICMDADVAIRVASCSHGMCLRCAFQLCSKGRAAPLCPFCRQPIAGFDADDAAAAALQAPA
jgi:hypothetical protein